MSGEEEKVPEAEAIPCPFCDGEMGKLSEVDTREGTEVIYRCQTCGFEAKFIKGA